LKILMVTHYFGSHKGGIEIVAEELFRQFVRRGHPTVWAAGNATPPPEEEAQGTSRTMCLPISNFVEEKLGLPFPIPSLATLKEIRAEVKNADLIVLHDCLYLSNIAAFVCARRQGIPTVVVQHIGSVPYKNAILNGLMRLANMIVTKPMLAAAEQVVFISQTTKSFFDKVRFRREPRVVFNGVDTDLYRPAEAPEEKLALRRKYGLPDSDPVILFVGRFVEKKGLSLLERMVRERPGYTWAFAGWGPLDPRSWNAQNVKVFSGLRGASMAELYRACDVFVLPSVGEGFPLVIQEALATGMPVVCSAETATADALMEGFVRSVALRKGDPGQAVENFLAAVDEMLRNGLNSEKEAAERRAFAVERYSWQKTADRYLEIAKGLCPPQTLAAATSSANVEKVSR
jgi:glycosyltransferase involved in cell wall biosynthesis